MNNGMNEYMNDICGGEYLLFYFLKEGFSFEDIWCLRSVLKIIRYEEKII